MRGAGAERVALIDTVLTSPVRGIAQHQSGDPVLRAADHRHPLRPRFPRRPGRAGRVWLPPDPPPPDRSNITPIVGHGTDITIDIGFRRACQRKPLATIGGWH